MTRAARAVSLAVIVIAAIAITAFFLWRRGHPSGETTQAVQAAAPAMKVGLALTAGAPGGPVALSARLSNPWGRHAALRNRAAKNAGLTNLAPEPVRTITLVQSREEWISRFSIVRDTNGTRTPIPASALTLVRAPAQAPVSLGPEDVQEVVFRLDASAVPPAGSQLRAVFAADVGRFESNSVTVPQSTAAEVERLVRQGRTAQALRDNDELLRIGDALVALDSSQASGYWYRGLALEAKGDDRGALAAYEETLARLKLESTDLEPPVGVYRRIQAVSAKLSKQ